MNPIVKKYFWSLNDQALEETARILRDPSDKRFLIKAISLLSHCTKPHDLFRAIPREIFFEQWPSIKRRWNRVGGVKTNIPWWDSICHMLVSREGKITPDQWSAYLGFIGKQIKEARLRKEWSQDNLAKRIKVEQRLISQVESGKANITMETLLKIAKVLGIEKIELGINEKIKK
ncbi:MAG: helix-turn-helix transcriptional regulator [Candidatus Euphemobacter frigidus]|nr:helix-turn-helix transcriptional regulator [Candidatus Euphemobacter frigidus]MDP8276803.1 helix-turn-helix transcriptional regulator [Candidatus Euphemobacter frigidus]